MEFRLDQISKKLLAALLAFLIIFSALGLANPVKAEDISESGEVGYASTALLANPDYKASVGDEVVAEDMAVLSNVNMIELVAEDGTVYQATEVVNGEFYFDAIPIGTYSPRLTQAALNLGYQQDTPETYETTLTVNEGPDRVFRSSVATWFSKKAEVKTGYASTIPLANPNYKASVGAEIAAEDIKTLTNIDMIELVAEDGTVYQATEIVDGRLYFDEIPVGDYTPRLTQAAQDLGYQQDTPEGYERSLTVSEGSDRQENGSVATWFSKIKVGYAGVKPYANPEYEALVGEEIAMKEAEILLDTSMIELVAEDGTVYQATEVEDGWLCFDRIPVGTYTPRLTKAAEELGYQQDTPDGYMTTFTVSESPSRVFNTSVGIWFSKAVEIKTGKASTAPYANPNYKDLVGEEVVAEDIKTLTNIDMIELVAEDGTVYQAVEVADGRLYFGEVPVGTYSPRLTKAAEELGYQQDTPEGNETTLTVSAEGSHGSVGIWFSKEIENIDPTEPTTDPTTEPTTQPTNSETNPTEPEQTEPTTTQSAETQPTATTGVSTTEKITLSNNTTAKGEENKMTPKTGEMSIVAVPIILALSTVVLLIIKRKKNQID